MINIMKSMFDSSVFEDDDVVVEEEEGVAWLRGPLLGKGSFASVYSAVLRTQTNSYLPDIMAIKSAEVSNSISLQYEREVLHNLRSCPYIIHCYGDQITSHSVYNLLLEFASGGTLASLITAGFGLPASDVKRFTGYLVKGIDFIHRLGYVHCDLKPDNILLVFDKDSDCFVPKIGDFGLAKCYKNTKSNGKCGGTPLYMSPEAVMFKIQEPPCDIWALGCIVLEMLTGNKVWNPKPGMNRDDIFQKISNRWESPKIPPTISKEGKQFLKACLARNPRSRYTAERLLSHPFVCGGVEKKRWMFNNHFL